MRIVLTLLTSFVFSYTGIGQISQSDFPSDWTIYNNFDGVDVEYKYQECNSGEVKNQVLVLFKFSNNSTESKTLSWTTKHYRAGECYNCANIDSHEYRHEISLASGEIVEADGTSKANDNLYLFSSFINLAKGMPTTKLTAFEFINVNID